MIQEASQTVAQKVVLAFVPLYFRTANSSNRLRRRILDSSPGKNHSKKLMPRIPNAVLTFGESTFNRGDLLVSTLDLNWQ
jgi:hypothetical protein